MTSEQKKAIEHAKSYPFEKVQSSFIYINGEVTRCDSYDYDDIGASTIVIDNSKVILRDYIVANNYPEHWLDETRYPVISSGSNASPQRLREKYNPSRVQAMIPVVKGVLYDFDAVYAALISNYGSIPATLQHSPGTKTELVLNLLTAEQLETMHKSERSYNFCRLSHIHFVADNFELDTIYAYLSSAGIAVLKDEVLSLAAVHGENRIYRSISEEEILNKLMIMEGESDLDVFIYNILYDNTYRNNLMDKLRQNATSFRYPESEVVHGARNS